LTKKSKNLFLIATAFIVFDVLLVSAYFAWQFVLTPASANSQQVVFELKSGQSFSDIAEILHQQGVVKSAQAFSIYARISGSRARIKRGEYLLNTHMRPAEVLAILTSGKSIARSFTVSEGLNIFDIATLFETKGYGKREDFLSAAFDSESATKILGFKAPSFEGFLFPETYQITKYTTAKELVAAMARRHLSVWQQVTNEANLPGWTPMQVVTLASIIEKETGAAHERPLISSVFHNRLQKRMKLQTDPTILYGMALEQGQMPTAIGKADILRPTKYNTYTIAGLPPGPIANPGLEAIKAALRPASSEYLFFVSQNNGTHVFSKNYADHNTAVRKFQLDAKAREGKSWRDLSK
jgi:UPF0755 protein